MLVPQQGELASRKDACLASPLLGDYWISVPIISANMPSVTDHVMAVAMHRAGGYGVLHRFNTIEENVSEYIACQEWDLQPSDVGISLGLHDGLERAERLVDVGANVFFLDVAHGHSKNVFAFLETWNVIYNPLKIELIVGNVATRHATLDLLERFPWIAGLKVGIGPGAACTTREVTGFGVPQWTAIQDVREGIDDLCSPATLIADGGCKNSGDIVKALAIGADTVMIGRLLAGTNESPEPGVYYGSASAHVNGHNAPEGAYGEIERDGSVEDVIKKLAWGIRSGISYGGGTGIADLRQNAQWQRVSPLSAIESGVRF